MQLPGPLPSVSNQIRFSPERASVRYTKPVYAWGIPQNDTHDQDFES